MDLSIDSLGKEDILGDLEKSLQDITDYFKASTSPLGNKYHFEQLYDNIIFLANTGILQNRWMSLLPTRLNTGEDHENIGIMYNNLFGRKIMEFRDQRYLVRLEGWSYLDYTYIQDKNNKKIHEYHF
mgnify:CR=1 FL=1